MPDKAKLNIDPTKPWYSFQAATSEGEKRRAKIQIYDVIGGWFGIQTSEFVRELNALDVDEIELHLNSPGGSAFDGIAIHNALRQHQATVTVIVDGLAASAASAVAMGGDEVVMAHGSMLMVHDASAIAWGNAADCRKTAELLDKLSNNYADLYARKAGGSAEEWRQTMLAETWYSADEAVEVGLADRTDEEAEADAEAVANFDLSMFVYAGRENAPSPKVARGSLPAAALGVGFPPNGLTWSSAQGSAVASASVSIHPQTPVSSEPGNQNRKEEARMDEFLADLRTRLGLNAGATTEEILAALDKREQSTTPPGTVLIEEGVLATLKSDAAAGREAREQQIKDRRDGIVASALRQGRITKVTAADFRTALDKDEEGITKILAAMPASGAVNVTENGEHLGDPEASKDDALFESMFGSEKEA